VYERESDQALVVGAGIPESWIRDPAGVRVESLPTYFGPLSYSMNAAADSVVVTLSGSLQMPAGKIIVASQLPGEIKQVRGDGRISAHADEVIIDRLPARVVLVY
jgi:hypothetical protein